tara:strand:+ start:50564 stop:51076 length:513 start_codon:yes stop_codon:yes gene_type:complete
MSSHVRVWFYNPVSDTTGYFNKMVAYIDGPFCHCEIQFPDETAFTVYMGTNVIKKQRRFDPMKYTCVTIPCTHKQMKIAREHADAETSAKRCFSLLMMTLAFSVVSVPANQGTFCSKLCADVLIAANLIQSQDTRHISPSALFRCLHREYVEKTALPCSAIDFTLTPKQH